MTTISQEKREFIKKCAEGLNVKMSISFQSLEISISPDCDQEEYIKKHILKGTKFSVYKFCEAVDSLPDEELTKLLEYFDSVDMVLWDVFEEACIYDYDLTFNEMFYAKLIKEGEIHSFRDLINY